MYIISSKFSLLQAISPGIVETEFFPRMVKDDAAGKEAYGKLKCLQSDDIADSVLHVLSAPPHVQVCDIEVLASLLNCQYQVFRIHNMHFTYTHNFESVL